MGQKAEQLQIAEVEWQGKPGSNGYLLRELFGLLLRDPDDLTDRDGPARMPLEGVSEEEGGEG